MMENVDALESSSDPCSMVAPAFKKNALIQHILHQGNESDSKQRREQAFSRLYLVLKQRGDEAKALPARADP
jgi:hypothetical protein